MQMAKLQKWGSAAKNATTYSEKFIISSDGGGGGMNLAHIEHEVNFKAPLICLFCHRRGFVCVAGMSQCGPILHCLVNNKLKPNTFCFSGCQNRSWLINKTNR